MKKIFLFIIFSVYSSFLFCETELVSVRISENNSEIEEYLVSATKITIRDWLDYLKSIGEDGTKFLAGLTRSMENKEDINYDWSVWNISWKDAISYCNWLSEKDGLEKCYEYDLNQSSNNMYVIRSERNGYRLPYVSEWLYLAEYPFTKTERYYEEINSININEPNKDTPFEVKNTKMNKYGLYDLLGNIPEYCNDYYREDFSLDLLKKFKYGPDTYTPDPDEVYFHTKLHEVRCYAGGYWWYSFSKISSNLINAINIENSKDFIGFRIMKRK